MQRFTLSMGQRHLIMSIQSLRTIENRGPTFLKNNDFMKILPISIYVMFTLEVQMRMAISKHK